MCITDWTMKSYIIIIPLSKLIDPSNSNSLQMYGLINNFNYLVHFIIITLIKLHFKYEIGTIIRLGYCETRLTY